MKVNYSSEDTNEEFLSTYPQVPAYPHFFVLDTDGSFLHSQGTAELEEGRGYNERVFLEFLERWKPVRIWSTITSRISLSFPDSVTQCNLAALHRPSQGGRHGCVRG